jgi:cation transport ATPase
MANEKNECDIETIKKMSGLGMAWRISASVVSAFSWLAFFILWLAFYAGDYNVYENIAILILSVVAFVVVNVAVWIPFGLKLAGEECRQKKTGADIASILAGVGWLVFAIYWLLQYAGDYSIYQNIAVFIVSILVFGGISAAAHAASWARNPKCN